MLFRLYCLPGRLFWYFNWLAPQKDLVAAENSERRRNSKLMHFLTSTSLYFFVAVFVSAGLRDDADRVPAAAAETLVDNEASADVELTAAMDEESVSLRLPDVDVEGDFGGEPVQLQPEVPAETVTTSAAEPPKACSGAHADAPSAMCPEAQPGIQNVMRAALSSGNTGRWNEGAYSGYVVVSAPQTLNGEPCRNVSYTVTGEGENWQSPSKMLCQKADGSWQ